MQRVRSDWGQFLGKGANIFDVWVIASSKRKDAWALELNVNVTAAIVYFQRTGSPKTFVPSNLKPQRSTNEAMVHVIQQQIAECLKMSVGFDSFFALTRKLYLLIFQHNWFILTLMIWSRKCPTPTVNDSGWNGPSTSAIILKQLPLHRHNIERQDKSMVKLVAKTFYNAFPSILSILRWIREKKHRLTQTQKQKNMCKCRKTSILHPGRDGLRKKWSLTRRQEAVTAGRQATPSRHSRTKRWIY